MKKRLIISLVLLLIAVSLSLTSYTMIIAQIGKLRESLYDALYTAELTEPSFVMTENVTDAWNESQKTLHIFIIHSDMTELEAGIMSLSDFFRENSSDKYLETCILSIHRLDNIENSVKVNVENIL